jgi:hypothetical protein
MAGLNDAEVSGLQFEIDSNAASNKAIRESEMRNQVLKNEDIARDNQVANQNRLSAHQFRENVKANNAAHESTEGNNIRAFLE